ncbi:MAG: hypothetical protein K2K88_02515, partial [Muribaculaceae bacterium]|nr:hypothetical protein [Muribaculaceae bacterium]
LPQPIKNIRAIFGSNNKINSLIKKTISMNKNQMEFLLSQELNEVKGGLKTACTCDTGAFQGNGDDHTCSCKGGAKQAQDKEEGEQGECSCQGGAQQS